MFTHVPAAKNLSLAFLPDTFTRITNLSDYYSPVDEEAYLKEEAFYAQNPDMVRERAGMYVVACYWHDINVKAGRHVASYGEFTFDISTETLWGAGIDPKNANYEDMLGLTLKRGSHLDGTRKTAFKKIGRAKPWSSKIEHRGLRDLLTQQYDAASHQNMLINPNDVPLHADGWYNTSRRKPYEKP